MDLPIALLILTTGLVAGFFNTVAGGGSLLSMPVLIFAGLDPVIANATNRVAIVLQNIFAVAGFKHKGFFRFRYTLLLAIVATLGAIIGAKIAVDISSDNFKRILSLIMLFVLVLIIVNPTRKLKQNQPLTVKQQLLATVMFFGVGIYGGFIQIGVGFLILLVLTLVNGMDLVTANSIKVGVVLVYTIVAVAIFAFYGKIHWQYGLVLAIGNGSGGWLGSQLAVAKGEKWLRLILVLAVLAMIIKLSGVLDLLWK